MVYPGYWIHIPSENNIVNLPAELHFSVEHVTFFFLCILPFYDSLHFQFGILQFHSSLPVSLKLPIVSMCCCCLHGRDMESWSWCMCTVPPPTFFHPHILEICLPNQPFPIFSNPISLLALHTDSNDISELRISFSFCTNSLDLEV